MIGTIIQIIIILFSITIHEVSHGEMANRLGDDTAKNSGRLTLNPLKHLDLFGSIILPFFLILVFGRGFGWAKPVPVNPFNLRDRKWGEAKVAFAGPLSNILIAVFFGLLLRFVPFGNFYFGEEAVLIFSFIVWANLLLAVFNLIPIPPLDGSHILFAFLPEKYSFIKENLSHYGFMIMIFFLMFFLQFLMPVVSFLFNLITGW